MPDTDDKPLDTLSVAPDAPNAGNQERNPRQDAGQDESITRRLERDPEGRHSALVGDHDPESTEARLDNGLDESMDASDPISLTQPAQNDGPAASSGYDEEAERELRQGG